MSETNKTKTIRISEETINMLGKQRQGFETPDQCLQRILSSKASKKVEAKMDDDSHKPYYDSYGNHWTYDEEGKIWTVCIDAKNVRNE